MRRLCDLGCLVDTRETFKKLIKISRVLPDEGCVPDWSEWSMVLEFRGSFIPCIV